MKEVLMVFTVFTGIVSWELQAQTVQQDIANLKKIISIQQAEIAKLKRCHNTNNINDHLNCHLQTVKKGERVCSGKTPHESTDWKNYSASRPKMGAYVDIDISHCNFTTTPILTAGFHGDGGHWEATYGIYNISKSGFRIYVKFPTYKEDGSHHFERGNVLDHTKGHRWHIHWIAVGT